MNSLCRESLRILHRWDHLILDLYRCDFLGVGKSVGGWHNRLRWLLFERCQAYREQRD